MFTGIVEEIGGEEPSKMTMMNLGLNNHSHLYPQEKC